MLAELQTLAAQYARSRETLYRTVEGLSAQERREPFPGRDWSIHDTLVHIAANERLMTELLRGIAQGTATAAPADFDNERFNAESVAAGRSKSDAELRAALDASYADLMRLLASITPEQLERRGTHPLSGEMNVKEFLLAMYAHHEVHCRDVIEQARRVKKTGSD